MFNKLSTWLGFKTKAKTMAMAEDEVKLPPDLPNWPVVKDLLIDLHIKLTNQLIADQETGWYMQMIYNTIQSDRPVGGNVSSQLGRLKAQIQSNVKKKLDHNCLWYGVVKFLRKAPRNERETFLFKTLPKIIELALNIARWRPDTPLQISQQQHGGSTILSRRFVASIVACFFLCLFPERKREDSANMNIINFTMFFKHLPVPTQVAKLRCILHYFECIIEREFKVQGNIIFSRKVAADNLLLTFEELVQCDVRLCPMTVHTEGSIEDSEAGAIKVVFGNRSLGGGVLGRSRVQEEIQFAVCPELLAAMLFVQNIESNESIYISGFEQFSQYKGYADSFEFVGHYEGGGQPQTMVTIDAVPYRGAWLGRQYEEQSVLRDVNKAVVGFCRLPGTVDRAWVSSHMAGAEGEKGSAEDVAADLVTSVMSDASHQAVGSSTFSVPPSRPHTQQPHQASKQISSQQFHPSSHTQHGHSHFAHVEVPSLQFSSLPDYSSSVDPAPTEEGIARATTTTLCQQPSTAAPPSGTLLLQTAQSRLRTSHADRSSTPLSSLSSDGTQVSTDSCSFSKPSQPHHSTGISTTSAAATSDPSLSAQAFPYESPSLSTQSYLDVSHPPSADLLPAEGDSIRHPTLSQSVTFTPAAVTPSLAESLSVETSDIDQPSVLSAFFSDSYPTQTEESPVSAGDEFTSDILGNLAKIQSAQHWTEQSKQMFTERAASSEGSRLSNQQQTTEVFQRGTGPNQPPLSTDTIIEKPATSADDADSKSPTLPLSVTEPSDAGSDQTAKTITQKECPSLFESVDVVLSLPALQSGLERVSSGLSNLSMVVNVDSPSVSTNSAEEENNRKNYSEVLYVSVEDINQPITEAGSGQGQMSDDGRATSIDSMHLEPPLSTSPQSSLSSTNISPNTSFVLPEPPNGSSDVHVTADFFIPGLEHGILSQPRPDHRRSSRDLYYELRDFLGSSSSGSRGSGSGGVPFSSNSSSGSRSGSISSHGTNGSTNDYLEFWHHFRRRSSQFSDTTTSRRSSSSKHSSDFSTDLEDITEGLQKHGVIEEESSLLTVVTDFASSFVTAAVRNGVTTGAHHLAVPEVSTAEQRLTQAQQAESLAIAESEKGVEAVQETAAGFDIGDVLTLGSARRGKPFSRAGTLVRQVEISLDQEELKPHSETMDSSQSHKEINPSVPVSEEAVSEVSVTEQTSHKSKSELEKLIVAPSAPQPVCSTSSVPVLYVHRSPRAGAETSESADSGFISKRSSVTSTSESKTEFSGPSIVVSKSASEMPEEASVTAKTEFSAFSVPFSSIHSASPQGGSPQSVSPKMSPKMKSSLSVISGRQTPEPKPDSQRQYVILESKTINLPPQIPPPIEQPSKQDVSVTRVPDDVVSMTAGLESQSSGFPKSDIHVQTKKFKPKGIPQHPKDQAEDRRADKAAQTGGSVPKYSKISKIKEAGASSVQGVSEPTGGEPWSGACGPSRSSGIPRFVDSSKKASAHSKGSHSSPRKSKSSPAQGMTSTGKEKLKSSRNKQYSESGLPHHKSAKKPEPFDRPHKSRYVVSDVALPLIDRKKKLRDVHHETGDKKQHRSSSKKHEDRRHKHKGESSKMETKSLIRSRKFVRFVNSIAEMSLSQAVLEGAEIVAKTPAPQEEISDEVYNWFAGRIVNEVFMHVTGGVEAGHGAEVAGGHQRFAAVGASDAAIAQDSPSTMGSGASAHLPASGESENQAFRLATGKPKSILPSKSEIASSEAKRSGLSKGSGSFKVVKFKEGSSKEEKVSLPTSSFQTFVTPPSPAKTNATSTFQRASSSGIPVPIRRRSSLDLPMSSSPPGAWGATSLPSPYISKSTSRSPSGLPSQGTESGPHQPRLDLSLDIYQAAAVIVNQVFQAVSDSMDTQALSPVSSGRQGTTSSTDTGLHSTGSRVNSQYESLASNIFSSTSAKTSDSPKRARRSVSPSIGIFSRKPMSRETLTNAFLKVEGMPSFKTYERRSSEPCSTSVQLSLQAFNSIKFNNKPVEDKQRKISRTDDDIGRGKVWRRGSLDGFSFERRNSCGFKDPVLSRFAEELMKADTSVPELVIVGSQNSSSSASSRRSSFSAFRDTTLANLESELLNTSFTSGCSVPLSHSPRSQHRRSHLDRSRSRESRNWKSDSSDTEYWFPPPRIVGEEFQQEFNRQHSQEELQDYASFFAGRVMQEAVCVIKSDPEYMSKEEQDVDMYAENLSDQIMRDAFLTMAQGASVSIGTETGSGLEISVTLPQPSEIDDAFNFGRGARPKQTSETFEAVGRTQSQPRRIPQRKEGRRDRNVETYQGASIMLESSCHTQGQQSESSSARMPRGRYTASASEQFLHPHSQPSSVDWGGARPKQGSRYQRPSTDSTRLSPSRWKRHSSPASMSPSSSSSSLKPSSPSSLQVPPRSLHRQRHIESQHALRSRSKSESASTSLSNIQVHHGSPVSEISKQVKTSGDQRRRHPMSHSRHSSFSSNSSYHSILDSSSESIGPSGTDQRRPVEQDVGHRRSRISHIPRKEVTQTQASETALQERVRQENQQEQSTLRPRGEMMGQSQQWEGCGRMGDGIWVGVNTLATELSISVLADVFKDCRNNRWLKYMSHHQPIATGNWGCGAYRGNAQLKLVIQWLAASIGQAPALTYYTFGNPRVAEAQEIVDLLSGWTVGRLASALRDYCNWVRLNLSSSSSGSSLAPARPSPRQQQQQQQQQQGSPVNYFAWQEEEDGQLPQSLFNFLRHKHDSEDREDR